MSKCYNLTIMITRFDVFESINLIASRSNNHHYYLISYKENSQTIVNIKYQINLPVIKIITNTIAEQLPSELADLHPLETDWVITSVPLHWKNRLTRKFDLNAIISRKIARATDFKYKKVLRNTKTRTQGSCQNRTERLQNAKDKFCLKQRASIGRNIILFDDVVATGATMRSSEKLLRSAGAKNVVWLSIAH